MLVYQDLPREIRQLVFLELPGENLSSIEQVCHDFKELCDESEQRFWLEKVTKDFGLDIFEQKPQDESFKKQYKYLQRISQTFKGSLKAPLSQVEIIKCISRDRIDTLLLFDQLHLLESEVLIANEAAKNGFFKMLNWLEAKKIYPSYDGYIEATKRGRLDVLIWGEARNGQIGGAIPAFAAEAGHLDMLIWLDQKGIRCYQMAVWIAVKSDKPEILSWLQQHGYYFNERATRAALQGKKMKSLDWLCRQGAPHIEAAVNHFLYGKDLDLMIWMIQNGYGNPDQQWSDLAASKGNISLLEFFFNLGILPSATVESTNFETFKWLIEHGVSVSGRALYSFISKTDLQGLNWLEENGIVDLETTVTVGLDRQKADLLRWALQRRYVPPPELLESEIKKGNLASLMIFEENGFPPSSRVADLAVGNNDSEALKWMESKGILPTKLGAYWARRNGKEETVKWLAQKGITWRKDEECKFDQRIKELLRSHY